MKAKIPVKPFAIPAIHNQKEALIMHLGLDSECESDFESVIEIYKTAKKHTRVNTSPDAPLVSTNIFTFQYSNYLYQVALLNAALKSDIAVSFNGSLYGIKELGNPIEKSKVLGINFEEFTADCELRLGRIPSLYTLRKTAANHAVCESDANDVNQAVDLMDKEKGTAIKLVLSLWDGQVLAEWEQPE